MKTKSSVKKSLFFQPYFFSETEKQNKIKWKKVDSEIKGRNNETYFKLKSVKAPESWSQTAIDIAASKYFKKSIKSENSVEALVDRIGQGLLTAVKQSGFFKSNKQNKQFVEEIKYLMLTQRGAFNSPVWFNCGLYEKYKLVSKSEHYSIEWKNKTDSKDKEKNKEKNKKIVKINNAYLRPQSSACFIQSVSDSLESIFDLVKSEAKLFKYGSGSGTNFSTLRSRYEPLNTGGTSSGLISFLEVLDQSAGAIKSGGVNRRAAKMVCVDIDHPEIEDFIVWKKKEEEKAKALVAMGYSSDLDGEAYKTVSGQNSNNSIRVSNQFMLAVENDENWNLISSSTKKKVKTVRARDLWNKICNSAWVCADPGIQFSDTINAFHTCASTDLIRASNPCSEYMFLDDSACNLASLNLVKFLDEQGQFLINDFILACRTFFIAQECLIDYSSYPTEKIASNSFQFRPLGLGFANLGSFLMRLGLPYDSKQGLAWAGYITSLMTGVAYLTSAEMAEAKGAFVGYAKNKKSMLKVIKSHQTALKNINWGLLPDGYKDLAHDIWHDVVLVGTKYGFRNAQATVIAPTGTIGLVMDCDTTGIEPEFSLIKTKKLSGGGELTLVNQNVQFILNQWDFSLDQQQTIINHILKTGRADSPLLSPEQKAVFKTAVGQDKESTLAPEAHLDMMAAVQPFVSGAISKTVNMPADSNEEDISRIYKQAWKLKLKSVAIYRDGSKFVQPLNQKKQIDDGSKPFSTPNCTECGKPTQLESGCYRCSNCGTTTACA